MTTASTPPLTTVFANALIAIAESDRTVCAITAAMPGGTGTDKFGRRFPKRTFDVGIAEQHAVTFAAGMAVEGLKPFVAIYSTFMQRAYDQIIHDVALQSLPVRMILDRAGLVGNDGATHHGSFDLAYMACVPGIVIMAPADEMELIHMVETAYRIDDRPSVVRYPRASAYGAEVLRSVIGTELVNGELPARGQALPIGKGRVIRQAREAAIKVCLFSIGTRLVDAVLAARAVEGAMPDVGVTVADARFMKPLDETLAKELAATHSILVTLEEGSRGGFGDAVLTCLSEAGALDGGRLRVRSMVIPDIWIEQGPQKDQYDIAGLNEPQIVAKVKALVDALRLQSHAEPRIAIAPQSEAKQLGKVATEAK